MNQEISDPRPPKERAADITDARLFGLYHQNRLLEADDGAMYNRRDVLNIVRNAYLQGIVDKTNDPKGLAQFLAELDGLLPKEPVT